MAFWAKLPWLGVLGLMLVALSAVAARLVPKTRHGELCRWSLGLAWLCTLAMPAVFLFASNLVISDYWDTYYAVLAWMTAAAILPATFSGVGKAVTLWTVLAMVEVFFSNSLWLATAYMENHRTAFYLELLFALVLLVLLKLRFRPGWFITQLLNTLFLLLVGLPLAELFAGGPKQAPNKDLSVLKTFSTYHAAQKNPAANLRWLNEFGLEWERFAQKVLIRDASARLPFQLRPGSEGVLVQSHISINSKGFRGRELADPKGDLYRIVAVGESTTFGLTLAPDDKPWAELLEQLIHERLQQGQRVEVVNAGVPSLSLTNNLLRLKEQILPLKPDMIISYHGHNGFNMLNSALPPSYGPPPPKFEKRPSQLLAACEYRVKLAVYRSHRTARPEPVAPARLLETDYARAYRELIGLCQTNHIRLVLANTPWLSMTAPPRK